MFNGPLTPSNLPRFKSLLVILCNGEYGLIHYDSSSCYEGNLSKLIVPQHLRISWGCLITSDNHKGPKDVIMIGVH